MSEVLRWILLAFGAVLLAWIYFADKWRTMRSGGSARASSQAQIDDAVGNASPSAMAPPATVPIAAAPIATVPIAAAPIATTPIAPSPIAPSPIDWSAPLTEPITERIDPFDAPAAERRVGEPRRRWQTPVVADSHIDTRPVDPARRASAQEPRKIVTLRLLAAPVFEGLDVQAAFEAVELEFGRHANFHRLTADGAVVFSVASMTEPGTFDVEHMSQSRLAGLILYALLPGPLDGPATFTQLLNAATQLQQVIGGELQDERGVTLTAYRINRTREEVAKFRAGLI